MSSTLDVVFHSLTILINLGLLVTAIWAARIGCDTMQASRAASKAARAANEQAKRDSIEQTRPYVFVEILPGLAGLGTYDVRVKNVGRTAAYDLTLDYSDWPAEPDEHTRQIMTLFETRRTLPPTCSIRSYWRIDLPGVDEQKPIGAGTSGAIVASYRGPNPDDGTYRDSYEVLIDGSGLWPVPENGPEPGRMDGAERKQYKLLQAIARHIGELHR